MNKKRDLKLVGSVVLGVVTIGVGVASILVARHIIDNKKNN